MSIKTSKMSNMLGVFLLCLVLTIIFSFRTVSAIPMVNVFASLDSSGNQGNDNSNEGSISGDGGYVAFYSAATNLVSSDTNSESDVFRKNMLDGSIQRVSVSSAGSQGNNSSGGTVSISRDGNFVTFNSNASNLISSDTNGVNDIFLRDISSGTTEVITQSTSGTLQNGSPVTGASHMSEDARFVVFSSTATNLVSGDTNNSQDVFLRDRQLAKTIRISVSEAGTEGNSNSNSPSISCDGRYIAFRSDGTNLVSGDTNGQTDVFLLDRITDELKNITLSGNGYSGYPILSCDGSYIVFYSEATNIVSGDTNGKSDHFLYNVEQNSFEIISVDSSEDLGNDYVPPMPATISDDGRFVAFQSDSSDLVSGDTNAKTDVFLRDRQAGTTERMTVSSGGTQANDFSWTARISSDGRFVTYYSSASNLVTSDSNGKSDVIVSETGYEIPDPCQ